MLILIAIRQQLQRRRGRGLVLTALKTRNSERELSIPAELMPMLRTWKKTQAAERLRLGPSWADENDLVFTTPLGTPVDPDNFRHRFSALMKDAGLGEWTLHELRYSAGSLLYASGVDIKLIAEILGHSSDRVTREIYVKGDDNARAQALNTLSSALWGG